MNSNIRLRFIITATVILALMLLLVLWQKFGRKEPHIAPQTNALETKAQEKNPVGLSQHQTGPMKPPVNTETNTPIVAPEQENTLSQLVKDANVPIAFYGQVVDQDGGPMAGAMVQLKIRKWIFVPPAGSAARFNSLERISDTSGNFSVESETGDVLQVENIQKASYELEKDAKRSFGYNTSAQFRSQKERPVIFRMWRETIRASLKTGDKKFPLVQDGRPLVIDLFEGTATDSDQQQGDLCIWVKRPKNIVLGQRYDWACEIRAMNGGLLEETNNHSSMLIAPDDIYPESFTYERKATESGWGDSTGTKRFYLKLRNGQVYGRVFVEVWAYYNSQFPSRVRIQYAFNASGSRILR